MHARQVNLELCESDAVVTAIVAVFNERLTIRHVLRRLVEAPFEKQVIVVDDGSADGTMEILNAEFGFRNAEWKWIGSDAEGILLRHKVNCGKGAAIRTGLAVARGEYVVVQDADLEYDPAEIPWLIEPLVRGEADVVYGSRYVGGCPSSVRPYCRNGPDAAVHSAGARTREPSARSGSANRTYWSSRWGVRFLNWVVRLLYGVKLTDEATCYKVFRRTDLLRMDLQCTGFEFCPEVTAKACRMDLRILEVPISYHPRSRAEGKKIRWRDGIAAVRELWRWRKWRPESESFAARAQAAGVPCVQTEARHGRMVAEIESVGGRTS